MFGNTVNYSAFEVLLLQKKDVCKTEGLLSHSPSSFYQLCKLVICKKETNQQTTTKTN